MPQSNVAGKDWAYLIGAPYGDWPGNIRLRLKYLSETSPAAYYATELIIAIKRSYDKGSKCTNL